MHVRVHVRTGLIRETVHDRVRLSGRMEGWILLEGVLMEKKRARERERAGPRSSWREGFLEDSEHGRWSGRRDFSTTLFSSSTRSCRSSRVAASQLTVPSNR